MGPWTAAAAIDLDDRRVAAPDKRFQFRNGSYVFVNDKPHQGARDVFAVTEQGELENYVFYRRIK
jgi:hypothetical protein